MGFQRYRRPVGSCQLASIVRCESTDRSWRYLRRDLLAEGKGRGLRSVSMRECAAERVVNTRSHEEEEHGPAAFCVSRVLRMRGLA